MRKASSLPGSGRAARRLYSEMVCCETLHASASAAWRRLGGISNQMLSLTALSVKGWAGSLWTRCRTVIGFIFLKVINHEIKKIVDRSRMVKMVPANVWGCELCDLRLEAARGAGGRASSRRESVGGGEGARGWSGAAG